MKKVLSLILAAVMLLALCACANDAAPEQTTTVATAPPVDATATDADIAKLDSLYEGRTVRYGEMHAHADTGGRSDGRFTLEQWKAHMAENQMDFTTIVDHKQTLHMKLEQWDNTMFIGGSEAGGTVTDSPATSKKLHYNMLFATVEEFEALLGMYKYLLEFNFVGSYFGYHDFNVERMHELSNDIYANGGLFVHVHPYLDGCMVSDDPLDYMFGDVMGLEVFRGYNQANMNSEENQKAYKLWTDLLALGKRVYATAGSDAHGSLGDVTVCLGAIYAENTESKTLLGYMRQGNHVAGPAGIRMAVGDTQMGGEGSFAGQRLVVSAGEIHAKTYKADHTYRVDVYDDQGLVFSGDISGQEPAYFAIDANPNAKYYHANVYDVTDSVIVAVGNPIWNK